MALLTSQIVALSAEGAHTQRETVMWCRLLRHCCANTLDVRIAQCPIVSADV
jgi:hypothetical protein